MTKTKESSTPPAAFLQNGDDDILRNRLQRKLGRRKYVVIIGVTVVIVAGIAIGFKLASGTNNGSVVYKTAKIIKGDLTSTVTATGTLQAVNTVEVGAEISGRVEVIHADFNDNVTKGQLLAELDREQYEGNLAQSEAQVTAAQASVALAEATLNESQKSADRAAALSNRGLISQKELESAEAAASRAKASLESAKANAALSKASRDVTRSKLDKTRIYSPIDGTVLSRKIEIGQTVTAGFQTPVLFLIAEDLKKMVLAAKVDEADIGGVKVGQKATFTVDAYPDKKFDSVVSEVRNVAIVDQSVISYETRLVVGNPDLLLRPGMTATADITTESYDGVLLVSNAALRFVPPEMQERHSFGPPIPLIGSRHRDENPNKKDKEGPNKGQADLRICRLWITRNNHPEPLMAKRIATNGILTAIEGEGISEGTEILIDVESPIKTKP